MAIAPGDTVTFAFTLKLGDGTQVDETGDDPLTIAVGNGQLLECLERKLIGLEEGEQRQFRIPAIETLSISVDDAVQTLPRADFDRDMAIEPDMLIAFELPNGEEVAGRVIEADAEKVTVDFTHPLAGHDLVFDVKVLSVRHDRPGQKAGG